MSLSYAAITPHNPALIPSISKEYTDLFSAIKNSIEEIAKKINQLKVDTLIIISPHAPVSGKAFAINLADAYQGDFRKFGDLATQISARCDIELAYKIKEYLEARIPIQIYSETELDYGLNVPLFFLLQNNHSLKIIPLSLAELNKKEHFKFGQLLRKQIDLSAKKIAVISSLNLSHRHDKNYPGGYHQDSKKFDNEIKSHIKENNLTDLLNLPDDLINNALSCNFNSLMILAGLLSEFNYSSSMLNYEITLGIGHLTAEFNI